MEINQIYLQTSNPFLVPMTTNLIQTFTIIRISLNWLNKTTRSSECPWSKVCTGWQSVWLMCEQLWVLSLALKGKETKRKAFGQYLSPILCTEYHCKHALLHSISSIKTHQMIPTYRFHRQDALAYLVKRRLLASYLQPSPISQGKHTDYSLWWLFLTTGIK